MWTVEFNGNKGWEVGMETYRESVAMKYMRECIDDGYDVRITYSQGGFSVRS